MRTENRMIFGNHERKRPEPGESRMSLKNGCYENNT
jgi:hypothetical protein